MNEDPQPSKADVDDAKLTAFALGELAAEDAAAVEARLRTSPEARREVEEIRATAKLLSAEFSNEPALHLHDDQVDAIVGEGKVVRPRLFARHRAFITTSAVAACACLFAAVGMREYLAGLESRDRTDWNERAARHAADHDGREEKGGEGGEILVERPEPADERQSASSDGAAAAVGGAAENAAVNPQPDAAGDVPSTSDPPPVPGGPDRDSALGGGGAGDGVAVGSKPAAGAGRSAMKIDQETADAPLSRRSRAIQPLAPGADPAGTPQPQPAPAAPGSSPKREAHAANTAVAPRTERPVETSIQSQDAERAKKRGAAGRDKLREKRTSVSDPANSAGAAPPAPRPVIDDEALSIEGAGVRATETPADDISDLAERESRRAAAGESYGKLVDNPWVAAADDPRSTFAIDVDTGSYPNVRRFLNSRAELPPPDAVRIEEMVNYFDYDYPEPAGEAMVAVAADVASCPWQPGHRLVRIALKAAGGDQPRPPSNLVFLVDVSGSMRDDNKLGLLKRAMKQMVAQLNEDDRIGIVTYASGSGVALEPTSGDDKGTILAAIDSLSAGGSTNGAAGITQAYELAKANIVDGTNRVVLATDGDFNVGATDRGELVRMIEERAGESIFLTVLGVGGGNLKEARIEHLADKGNGAYHYLDSDDEAARVLVRSIGATLVTVAKDVKLQVTFDPAQVERYRLLGYANRMLPDEAHHDPAADAGEMGAGHTVTALYEVVAAGHGARDAVEAGNPADATSPAAQRDERRAPLLSVSVKYKLPEDDQAADEIVARLDDDGRDWAEASEDFRFAAAVAGFGMLLRNSEYAGELNFDLVHELASEGISPEAPDPDQRREFLSLVERAKSLASAKD